MQRFSVQRFARDEKLLIEALEEEFQLLFLEESDFRDSKKDTNAEMGTFPNGIPLQLAKFLISVVELVSVQIEKCGLRSRRKW